MERIDYLGKGEKIDQLGSEKIALAYDRVLLNEQGRTNVLFLDAHVEFVGPQRLKSLGIQRSEKADVKVEVEGEGERSERAWGEAVEGVQMRVHLERLTWYEGETPKFIVDMRNKGMVELELVLAQGSWEVELDGLWYRIGGVFSGWFQKLLLGPGQEHKDIEFYPGVWSEWHINGKPLKFTPGLHTVRLSFVPYAGDRANWRRLRVVSNAVVIEVLPAEADKRGWGEVVAGLQCGLRADKRVWKADETPKLQAVARNVGGGPWRLPPPLELFYLKVAGKIWRWKGPGPGEPVELKPGEDLDKTSILLSSDLRLKLSPGKHTVQLVIIVSKPVPPEAVPGTIPVLKIPVLKQLRIESNVVVIEVLPTGERPGTVEVEADALAALQAEFDELWQQRQDLAGAEAFGKRLLEKYTEREEQSLVYYQLAEMYAQGGQISPGKVVEYAEAGWWYLRNPDKKARLFVYWGDALQLSDGRRKAARIYLRGLEFCLRYGLPKEKPELPAVSIYTVDGPPEVVEKYRKENEREMVVRRQAERIGELVEHRQALTGQIVQLYAQKPDAFDELRALVMRYLRSEDAAEQLVTAAKAYRRNPETAIPVITGAAGRREVKAWSWGEAVEGIQIRLRAKRQTWLGEEVVRFWVDVRNKGTRELELAYRPDCWEVEVDGIWYTATVPLRGDVLSRPFMPGQQYESLPLFLDMAFGWRSEIGGFEIKPGRHIVRAALARGLSQDGRTISLRVASNPVEIEILPAEAEVKAEGEFDQLLVELKDEDARKRKEAARRLGELEDRRAIDSLIEVLWDEDVIVRKAAAIAIAQIQTNEDVTGVDFELEAIEDPHKMVTAAERKLIAKRRQRFVAEVEKETTEETVRNLLYRTYDIGTAFVSPTSGAEWLLDIIANESRVKKLSAIAARGTDAEKEALRESVKRMCNVYLNELPDFQSDPDVPWQASVIHSPGVMAYPLLLLQLEDDPAETLDIVTQMYLRMQDAYAKYWRAKGRDIGWGTCDTGTIMAYVCQFCMSQLGSDAKFKARATAEQLRALQAYQDYRAKTAGWNPADEQMRIMKFAARVCQKQGDLDANWGEAVNGLRAAVEFVPEKDSFALGERVGVRFHIQNVSDANIQFSSPSTRQDWASVKDSDGKEVKVDRRWHSGTVSTHRHIIKPGQTLVLKTTGLGFGDLDDRALVDIKESKKYYIGSVVRCGPGQYSISYKVNRNLETGIRKVAVTARPQPDPRRFELVLDRQSIRSAILKLARKYRARICFEEVDYNLNPALRISDDLVTGTFTDPTIPKLLDKLTQNTNGRYAWTKYNRTYIVHPAQNSRLMFPVEMDVSVTPFHLENVVRRILDQGSDSEGIEIIRVFDGPIPETYPKLPVRRLWIKKLNAMFALSRAVEETGKSDIIWTLTQDKGQRRLTLHYLPEIPKPDVQGECEGIKTEIQKLVKGFWTVVIAKDWQAVNEYSEIDILKQRAGALEHVLAEAGAERKRALSRGMNISQIDEVYLKGKEAIAIGPANKERFQWYYLQKRADRWVIKLFDDAPPHLSVQDIFFKCRSVDKLVLMGERLTIYAAEHQGKLPENLEALEPYILDKRLRAWLRKHVEYLGKGKEMEKMPSSIVAYTKTLVSKDENTSVLFNDGSVAFDLTKKFRNKQPDVQYKDLSNENIVKAFDELITAVRKNDTEKLRKIAYVQVEGDADRIKEVLLPDVEDSKSALELATGELIEIRTKADDFDDPAFIQALKELREGELIFGDGDLACLRGATIAGGRTHSEGGLVWYEIPKYLPSAIIITTAEGNKYNLNILEVSRKGCLLAYSPISDYVEASARPFVFSQYASAGELERVESANKLYELCRAALLYASDYEERYPDSLHQTKSYLRNEQDLQWILENVEYLGKDITPREVPDTPVAYDKTMFEKGDGTNVAFMDGHVEYVQADRLKKLGIKTTEISIEVRFLTVSEDFLNEIGLDANSIRDANTYQSLGITETATPLTAQTYSLILDQYQVDFLLRTVKAHKDARALIAPRVTVLDGQNAEVKVHSRVHYISGYSEPNLASEKPVPKHDSIEQGNFLWVKPKLSLNNKSIDLDFESKIRRLLGFEERKYKGKYLYKIPQLEQVTTKVRCPLPNGQSLLIAGQKITAEENGRKVNKTLIILLKACPAAQTPH